MKNKKAKWHTQKIKQVKRKRAWIETHLVNRRVSINEQGPDANKTQKKSEKNKSKKDNKEQI